jgi:5-methylcytosine-specific restriction protein A
MTLDELLESLRPRSEGMIMDLVAAAGIDVSSWAMKQDGTVVKNPRANPNYCYEWAFGGNGQPTALCVWHSSLEVSDDSISYEDSLRQHALALDVLAIDRSKPTEVRARSRDQAKRARNFDSLLQKACRKSERVRVVLLFGQPRAEAEIGWETSKVQFRSLDTESWYVDSYRDGDGTFRLLRGLPPPIEPNAAELQPAFVDQFVVPEIADRQKTTGTAYPRSPQVRQAVLNRAKGICEYCKKLGFTTASGAVYLETHHVIPLSENGPDIEWNLVAICANDHRCAHFGSDSGAIRDQLIQTLLKMFPGAKRPLGELLKRDFDHSKEGV